ncbi:MAG: ATP-dependent Clp protease ATP-binding subunit [Bacteroidales bacterium]|nr:ATP-dependent Clp protease ATP-binding subunit [Bacteroidales bacterium]
MQLKISEQLNEIFRYAREEAVRTGNYGILPDHLFLGIIRHGDNAALKAITALGIDPQQMKNFIDEHIFTKESIPYDEQGNINLSRYAQNVLNITLMEAARLKSSEACPQHLLLALCRSTESYGLSCLRQSGIDYGRILAYLEDEGLLFVRKDGETPHDDVRMAGNVAPEAPKEKAGTIDISEFGYDLTEAAREGKLDPVVGRDVEIARVIEILGRRKKNNPMLVGEPGVGKSAIVEGIALRIASGDISAALSKKRIVSLDIASVVAGTKYRGDFEKRLKDIIKAASEDENLILFIDEFHTIVGAGGAAGGLDAANMLKPALARGEFQCIGATTLDEFTKIVEKDGALDRRFQRILVEPTGIAESIEILRQISPSYEEFHHVKYTPEALEACVRLTDRYITEKSLPDKAVDAMDEAGSMVRLKSAKRKGGDSMVTADDIATVVSKMSGIPVNKVAESEGKRILMIDKRLHSRIIGQDSAIDTVVRAIKRNRAGLKSPERPIGTFLFFGPTGVGKTRLARTLADYMFDSEDNIVRIDMSEYMEKFSVSRLIGAPPGYVGYDEGGQLSEPVRRKPYCVVLLDEIEKAHPDIFNILLQIMDEGRLTDSNGRTVNFKNTIVIMTSNIGSREIEQYGSGIGFATAGKDVGASRKSILEKAVKAAFPPEFINRVDEKVYFNALTREDIEKIIDIELKDLRARAEEAGYLLQITPSAKRLVADTGYDPNYGARPLKRAISALIEDPVSDFIIKDRILLGKHPGSTPRMLKVSLSQDRESTVVELK